MAGRQRPGPPPTAPPHHHPGAMIDDPHRLLLRRGLPPPLEDRIAAQHRDIQALLVDNQRLAATHVALKQDLSLAEQELQKLASTARKVRDERESEVKEVFERSLQMEAEFRGVDALKAELAQVRADVQRLTEGKIELTVQLKSIDDELARAKLEVREVPAIRAEIEAMRQELHKGRAAIEFEKKTRAANLEQSRAMERNMISMQHEIDKLVAELADAEKRARAAAAAAANPNPGYMGNYGSPNMAYGGGPYSQHSMHQAQTMADGAPSPYGPSVGSHGSLDMQQTHVPNG